MIRIKDELGIIREPKIGEPFAMRDGRLYTVDRAGALHAVRAGRKKKLSPSKQRRKQERAARLAATQRK